MATHRETATIEDSSPAGDPAHRLLNYYLANGYRVVERRGQSGERITGADDASVSGQPVSSGSSSSQPSSSQQDMAGATLERGRPGAGWWTSDMTELHTVVVFDSDGEHLQIDYEIETTGQMLNDVEKAFWRREIQWARRYVSGENEQPRDLREEEARRAKNQSSDIRSIGIWGAVFAFVLIVALGFFGII